MEKRQFVQCTYSDTTAYTKGKIYEVKNVCDKRFEFVAELDDAGHSNSGSYPFDGGLWKFKLIKEEETMNNKEDFTVEGSIALKKALVEELGFEDSAICYRENLTTSRKKKHITSTTRTFSRHFILPIQYNEAKQAFIDFYKEEEFVVGKWYIEKKNKPNRLLNYSGNVYNNYGVWDGKWATYYSMGTDVHPITDFKLATEEEVEQMLITEAKKRGFTYGASFTGLRDAKLTDWASSKGLTADYTAKGGKVGDDFRYNPNTDTLTTFGFGVYVVYENGKWADINKTPDITINGYKAEFKENHVEFGCAKFGKGLFESIIALTYICFHDI